MRRTESRPIGDDVAWARGVVARAWQSDIGSSDNEIRFLMNMERGLDRFGARMFVSKLQLQWLRDIEGRLDREDADEETGGVTPVDEVLR